MKQEMNLHEQKENAGTTRCGMCCLNCRKFCGLGVVKKVETVNQNGLLYRKGANHVDGSRKG